MSRTILLDGPFVDNKGDALMVEAIRRRLGSRYRIRLAPGPPRTRLARALRRAASTPPWERLVSGLRGDVAVFDCSGFRYGDPWIRKLRIVEGLAPRFERVKRRGQKLVMLPQSLGPFTDERLRRAFRKLTGFHDLLFARDRVSRQYALEAGADPEKVRLAPDYSGLAPGEPPDDPSAWSTRVCIVPNQRMLDRTPPETSRHYLEFLRRCVLETRARGLEPCIVLHAASDRPLAQSLQEAAGGGLRIVDETPLRVKGLLGSCFAVVGSRYHSLIAGLSQGVPTLGTSWTHKYPTLFEEYGCPECLMTSLGAEEELRSKLGAILDAASRSGLRSRLLEASARQERRVEAMWDEIERVLQPSPRAASVRARA